MSPGEWPEVPGVRWLAYWTLRRERICASPAMCPYSGDGLTHGPECELTRLERLVAESAAGALLLRAHEIDFALQAGFTVTLADVTAEEFSALLALRLERERFEEQTRIHGSPKLPH